MSQEVCAYLTCLWLFQETDGSDETNEDESTLGNAVGAKLSDEQAKAQKTSGKIVRSVHKSSLVLIMSY